MNQRLLLQNFKLFLFGNWAVIFYDILKREKPASPETGNVKTHPFCHPKVNAFYQDNVENKRTPLS